MNDDNAYVSLEDDHPAGDTHGFVSLEDETPNKAPQPMRAMPDKDSEADYQRWIARNSKPYGSNGNSEFQTPAMGDRSVLVDQGGNGVNTDLRSIFHNHSVPQKAPYARQVDVTPQMLDRFATADSPQLTGDSIYSKGQPATKLGHWDTDEDGQSVYRQPGYQPATATEKIMAGASKTASDAYDSVSKNLTDPQTWKDFVDPGKAIDNAADTTGAALKGLGGSFHSAMEDVNVVGGALPVLYDKAASLFTGKQTTAAQDAWFKSTVDPLTSQDDAFDLAKNAGFPEKVAHAAGGALAFLSQAVLTGGESAVFDATVPTSRVVAAAVEHGVKASAVPAMTDAIDTGRKVYAETGDGAKAAKAAQVQYLVSTAGAIVPLNAGGSLPSRLAQGAASGAVTGEASREAMNEVLPKDMQTPFTPEGAALSAVTGGVLGLGGHAAPKERAAPSEGEEAPKGIDVPPEPKQPGGMGAPGPDYSQPGKVYEDYERAAHAARKGGDTAPAEEQVQKFRDAAERAKSDGKEDLADHLHDMANRLERVAGLSEPEEPPTAGRKATTVAAAADAPEDVKVDHGVGGSLITVKGEPVAHADTPMEANRIATDARQQLKDRRSNTALREKFDAMSPDERFNAMYAHDVTGIPNKRAYDDSPKKPVQVSIDADSLKWFNSQGSHEGGNELLKAIAQAGHEQAPGDFYHRGGDEFALQSDTPEEAQRHLDAISDRLSNATIEMTAPDGRKLTVKGIGITHGTGSTFEQADRAMERNKSVRTAAGLRAGRDQQPPGATFSPAETGLPGEQGHPAAEKPVTVLGQQIEAPAEPTPAQAEAGNYRKPTVGWKGLPIKVENIKGQVRKGVDSKGNAWESKTHAQAYGYIGNTKAADGEHVDVYMGPHTGSDHVFVIDQLDPTGNKYDEAKAVIGTGTEKQARALYLKHYPKGWKGLGAITQMSSDDFKSWLKDGEPHKPVAWRPQTHNLLSDPDVQERLRGMGDETGWSERGGHIIRKSEDPSSPDHSVITGRTQWLPYHPWFKDLSEKLPEGQYKDAIEKAIAGKPLGKKQQRVIDEMAQMAHDQVAEGRRRMAEVRELDASEADMHPDVPPLAQDDAAVQSLTLLADRAIAVDARAARDVIFHNDDRESVERLLQEIVDRGQKGDAVQRGEAAHSGAPGSDSEGARAQSQEKEQAPALEGLSEADLEAYQAHLERRRNETDPGHADYIPFSKDEPPPFSLTAPGGSASKPEPKKSKGVQADLFGDHNAIQSELKRIEAEKARRRSSGQESVETGKPDDLFSQSRQQTDLTETPKTETPAAPVSEKGGQPETGTLAERLAAVEKQLGLVPEPTKGATEDAGEKIGGARKDRWAERGMRLSDLDDISEAQAAELVNKKAVWNPDWQKLVDGGMPRDVAAMSKVLLDQLSARPRLNTPEGRRHYVESLGRVRDMMLAAKSEADLARISNAMAEGMPRGYAIASTPEEKSARDKFWSIQKGRRSTLHIDHYDRRKVQEMLTEGWPKKAAKAETGERPKPKGPEEPKRPHLDVINRVGPPVRTGDITSEQFVKDMGFRGIEFGNWAASDERQRLMNHAYEALHDLARVLNVPVRALSLNGQMGLALGARGGGKFAAHYEPGKLVINMTKLSGAGALAHEFGHAIDHYFGESGRPDAYTTTARGGSGWYHDPSSRTFEHMRPEMQEAWRNVMDALFNKRLPQAEFIRSRELALENSEANSRRLAEIAKEQPRDAKMIEAREEFAKRGREQMREQIAEAQANPDKVWPGGTTKFKSDAGRLGEYWRRPTEMFARAFEAFVSDKLKAAGQQSDYLVHGNEAERWANHEKGNPYPTADERTQINGAMQQLADTFLTRDEGDKRVLYSEGWDKTEPGPEQQGMPPKDVKAQVDAILSRMAVKPDEVRVVQSMKDLRGDPEMGHLADARDTVAGFHHPRTNAIVLVASQLHSPDHVAGVFAHEYVVHFGLRQAFGGRANADYQKLMDGVRAAMPAEVHERGAQAFGDAYDPTNRGHQLVASEEALAYYGQRYLSGDSIPDKIRRYIDKFLTMVRDWLRKVVGAAPKFDDLFVRQTLNDLHDFVTRGRGGREAGIDEPAFAKPADTFYSGVARAVDAAKREKGTGAEWEATLRNTPGVDENDVDALAPAQWLQGRGRIDKDRFASLVSDISRVSQPQSVRELGKDVLGREMASTMPLNEVDGGVLSALHHDQVQGAVVSRLPVDVVDDLRAAELSPKDLFSNPDMVVERLPVDHLEAVADGLLGAMRSVGADLRAKLLAARATGGNKNVLPALKASDLNSREVVGLLAHERLYHDGLPIDPGFGDVTRAGTETVSGSDDAAGRASNDDTAVEARNRDGGFGAGQGTELESGSAGAHPEDFGASSAGLLKWHTDILHEAGALHPDRYAITPQMRDSLLEGQPMFSKNKKKGPQLPATDPDEDTFWGKTGGAGKAYGAARRAAHLAAHNPVTDAFEKLFNPAGMDPFAEQASKISTVYLGQLAQDRYQAQEHLQQFARDINRMSPAQHLQMIDDIENGRPQANPKLQPIADSMRKMLDTWRDNVRGLGTGHLENFIENYFPHYWKDESKAKTIFASIQGRRPLKGPATFLKKRTIPTTKQGIEYGLTPATTNPLILTLLKVNEMQRYISGVSMMQGLKDAGLAKFVSATAPRPDGWSKIEDAIARVTKWSETEGGFVHYGDFYMPTNAARVINNHVGRSAVADVALINAFKRTSNLLNATQLSISGFHLGFTTLDAMTSKLALGMERVMHGEPLKAAAALLESATPAGAIANVWRGRKLLLAYANPAGATPEMRAIVQALTRSGGRAHMDRFYMPDSGGSPFRGAGLQSMRDDVRTSMAQGHNVVHAVTKSAFSFIPEKAQEFWNALRVMVREYPLLWPLEGVGRLVRATSAPIMEHIVPMQKLGVFADMAADYLRRHPDANPMESSTALQSIWRSVDNRLGEMVYDNLFWNRTFKDAMHLAFRAVGWNWGDYREIGGAPLDAMKALNKLAKTGKITADDIGHKIPYVLAMVAMNAIIGSVVGYLFNRPPKDLKDRLFPRTGTYDKDGTEQRVSLPSYMKDVYEYANHPLETTGHKLAPIWSSLYQIYTNTDYFGNPVWNPDGDAVEKWREGAEFVGRQFTPFSITNQRQFNAPAGQQNDDWKYDLLKSGSAIGVTPAPGIITKPEKIEERARYEERKKWISKLTYDLKRAREAPKSPENTQKIRDLQQQLNNAHQASRTEGAQYHHEKAEAQKAARERAQGKTSGLIHSIGPLIDQSSSRAEMAQRIEKAGYPALAGLIGSLPEKIRPQVMQRLQEYA